MIFFRLFEQSYIINNRLTIASGSINDDCEKTMEEEEEVDDDVDDDVW